MILGEYLFNRLVEVGLEDIFGVPGDFNLGVLNQLLKQSKLNFVGTCNELNAGYAADAYARLLGFGALVTTYAVGELSAVNAVAGAFAESVPVLHIVGAPATEYATSRALLHHTLGDYDIPAYMSRPVCCASARLDNPRDFVSEIDRVLTCLFTESKPAYLAIPADMVACEVPNLPQKPFAMPSPPTSDAATLEEALNDVCARLEKAKLPLLLPGIELVRRKLGPQFEKLVDTVKIPYATMLLSKSILSEDHDMFIGLYSGARSRKEVIQRVQESDCILIFGEKMTDFNTGGFTAGLTPANSIYVGWDFVRVAHHVYQRVYIHDMVEGLLKQMKPRDAAKMDIKRARDYCTHTPSGIAGTAKEEPMKMAHLFKRCSQIFENDSIVIAETGASLFAAAETKLPPGSTFVAQTFYGSIGYTVGACLGACVAAKKEGKQVYLFIGDGSLQVTVQDLSTMIRHKCNPIVICINNDGYTIERTITDNTYNDIQMWKYADLPTIFGGRAGRKCSTEGDFEEALADAKARPDELRMIEVVLDKWDCSDLLIAAGKLMAKNNKLDV